MSNAEAKAGMHRDPNRLASGTFDVLVVGAGIYGVWTAFDAAQRGLSVALIDQDDFGSATSANSQRIIHGGLRYLQHADLKRMRESVRERSNLFRMAPHLSLPQPFLVPTYPGMTPQNKLAMRVALKLNDLISWDRNRGVTSRSASPAVASFPEKNAWLWRQDWMRVSRVALFSTTARSSIPNGSTLQWSAPQCNAAPWPVIISRQFVLFAKNNTSKALKQSTRSMANPFPFELE